MGIKDRKSKNAYQRDWYNKHKEDQRKYHREKEKEYYWKRKNVNPDAKDIDDLERTISSYHRRHNR